MLPTPITPSSRFTHCSFETPNPFSLLVDLEVCDPIVVHAPRVPSAFSVPNPAAPFSPIEYEGANSINEDDVLPGVYFTNQLKLSFEPKIQFLESLIYQQEAEQPQSPTVQDVWTKLREEEHKNNRNYCVEYCHYAEWCIGCSTYENNIGEHDCFYDSNFFYCRNYDHYGCYYDANFLYYGSYDYYSCFQNFNCEPEAIDGYLQYIWCDSGRYLENSDYKDNGYEYPASNYTFFQPVY